MPLSWILSLLVPVVVRLMVAPLTVLPAATVSAPFELNVAVVAAETFPVLMSVPLFAVIVRLLPEDVVQTDTAEAVSVALIVAAVPVELSFSIEALVLLMLIAPVVEAAERVPAESKPPDWLMLVALKLRVPELARVPVVVSVVPAARLALPVVLIVPPAINEVAAVKLTVAALVRFALFVSVVPAVRLRLPPALMLPLVLMEPALLMVRSPPMVDADSDNAEAVSLMEAAPEPPTLTDRLVALVREIEISPAVLVSFRVAAFSVPLAT